LALRGMTEEGWMVMAIRLDVNNYNNYNLNNKKSKRLPVFRAAKPKTELLEVKNKALAEFGKMLEGKKEGLFNSITKYVKDFQAANPNFSVTLPLTGVFTMFASQDEKDSQLSLCTTLDNKEKLFLKPEGSDEIIEVAEDNIPTADLDSKISKKRMRTNTSRLAMSYDKNIIDYVRSRDVKNEDKLKLMNERYEELKIRHDILRQNLTEFKNMSKKELISTLTNIYYTAAEMLLAERMEKGRLLDSRGRFWYSITDDNNGYKWYNYDYDRDNDAYFQELRFTQSGLGDIEIKKYLSYSSDRSMKIEIKHDGKTILSHEVKDGEIGTCGWMVAFSQ